MNNPGGESADPGPIGSGRPFTARARAALVEGARELLAAELGFTDQSHLTRSVRAETNATPGALRTALAAHA